MEKIPDNFIGETPGEREKRMSKIICAWCKKDLGEKEGDGRITHGICEECAKEMEAEPEETKK